MPSTNGVSSNVCNQLNIIIFRSYFDNGFPRSRSTSRIVSGKFLLALCFTTRNTAALVAFEVVGGFGVGLDPGTVRCDATTPAYPAADDAALSDVAAVTLAAAVDGATSRRSRLNSLWERRSRAL